MKICFIGDVFLDNDVLKNMNKDVFWSDLHNSDLIVLNFEAPATTSDSVRENKKYNLKMAIEAVTFFKNRPVVLNLANNHIMDFKHEGLSDTVNIMNDHNIDYCGVGDDLIDSQKGISIQVKNKKIFIVGAADPRFQAATNKSSGTLPAKSDYLLPLIKKVRKEHDLIILTIHAGTEFSSAPSPYQIELAHSCIDAGADIIQYHHAHCLSGVELYKKGMIMYGTGNYVFPYSLPVKYNKWFESASFEVFCDFSSELKLDFKIHPVKLNEKGIPFRADKSLSRKIIKHIETASNKIIRKKMTLWRISELLKPSYILMNISHFSDIVKRHGFLYLVKMLLQSIKTQFRV